jgi:putative MATE family efflux protein
MTEKLNKMETMPVRKLVVSMAVPAMMSMMIQALYNIVDSIYVSRIGEDALTSVSLAFPIQLMVISLVMGTSTGITSLISRKLGEHDRESATRAANHGYVINIIYALMMLVFGLFFADNVVSLLTDDSNLINLTSQYIGIVLIFSFGRFIGQAGISTLQATGDMIHPMKAMLIGAISNIILDPIFIFGYFGLPAMGIRGAAIATVTGQILSFTYISLVIRDGRHEVDIDLRRFKVDFKIIKDIYVVAFPAIVMQSLSSILVSGLNFILIGFSSTAVAVLGVYYKLDSFVIMPVFGLIQGFMPIMGYNYGAKNRERMVSSLKVTLQMAFAVMIVGAFIFSVFPGNLLSMFNSSAEMVRIGTDAFKKLAWCLPLRAFTMVFSTAFQAVGKAYASLVTTAARQLVFILPLAWILAKIGGLGMLWYSFGIAELMAVIIIVPWLIVDLKKTFRKWDKEDEDNNEMKEKSS